MHHFKNIEPRRLFFGLIKATRRDGRGTFRTNFMETFILVILDSGRHMYIRWCKWSLKRALKSLDFVQDTARICNQSFWKPKVDPLVKQCPNMKIVHIFDIFKEPHWNTFDIDFGEALDKSDQNHQSLIISTLKLSRNQYSQMYISFLHLCLWFIFLYYIYRTIFLSPSNIQFKTRDRTYPHLTPPIKYHPHPLGSFGISSLFKLWLLCETRYFFQMKFRIGKTSAILATKCRFGKISFIISSWGKTCKY